VQEKPNSSNVRLVHLLTNKRGKLLREFQRLLVLLWPNNKQIRHWSKGSIIAGFLKYLVHVSLTIFCSDFCISFWFYTGIIHFGTE
jgi:hypothetical protein